MIYVQRQDESETESLDEAYSDENSNTGIKRLQDWTCEDVAVWLNKLGSDYSKAAQKFKRKCMDIFFVNFVFEDLA